MTDSRDPGRARRSRRAAAGWTLVVAVASLADPAIVFAPTAGGSDAADPGFLGIDAFVVAHLVAYGVLAWLTVGGTDPDAGTARTALTAVAVAAAVGVGVELLQAPVAARTTSVADALVNVGGAAVGAGLRAAARRR